MESGLQKMTTILPPDTSESLVAKLSIEQVVDESKEQGNLLNKYFIDKGEAMY